MKLYHCTYLTCTHECLSLNWCLPTSMLHVNFIFCVIESHFTLIHNRYTTQIVFHSLRTIHNNYKFKFCFKFPIENSSRKFNNCINFAACDAKNSLISLVLSVLHRIHFHSQQNHSFIDQLKYETINNNNNNGKCSTQ